MKQFKTYYLDKDFLQLVTGIENNPWYKQKLPHIKCLETSKWKH